MRTPVECRMTQPGGRMGEAGMYVLAGMPAL